MDKKKKTGIIAGIVGAALVAGTIVYKVVTGKKAEATEQAEENTQE